MVVKVLQKRASAVSTLGYNERKVYRGDAEVVAMRNVLDGSLWGIREEFRRRETDISVSARVRRPGFHMTVCPDAGDAVEHDDRAVTRLADELMKEIGMDGQPYAVFRHNDIDREHWHVISTTIGPDSRVIPDNRSHWRIHRATERLAEKYGYTVGRTRRAGEKAAEKERHGRRLTSEDPDKVEMLRSAFTDALKYNFRDMAEFRAILLASGVILGRTVREGVFPCMSVAGPDGRKGTASFRAESDLRLKAKERYGKAVARNIAAGGRKWRCWNTAVITYCAGKARTGNEFRQMLDECGLRFAPTMKDGIMTDYSALDFRHREFFPYRDMPEAPAPGEINERIWEEGAVPAGPLLTAGDMRNITEETRRLEKKRRQRKREPELAAKTGRNIKK